MGTASKLVQAASFVIFSSVFALTGCGGGGGDSGGPGGNPGPTGDAGPKLSATVSFDIADSESLVTTKNEASATPASPLGKMAVALGLQKKAFTFHEPGRTAAPGMLRGLDTTAAGATTTSTDTTTYTGTTTGTGISGPYPGADGVFTTNFFAVKADGSMDFAIKSDGGGSAPVMYTVLSKDGAYVYVAFQYIMAQDNCAIYKVSTADNSFSCLDSGYVPQDANSYQQYYSKKINGNIKPIQLDEEGNVYYLGYKVTDPNNFGGYYGQSPVVRKVSIDGTAATLTSDLTNVQSFLVMKNGELVYTYQSMGAGANDAGLKLYDPLSQSTNKLTDDAAGQWWGEMFFSVDDRETVVFGSSNSMAGGVFFGQRYGNGGRYVVQLDTSLFGKTSGDGWSSSSSPTRLIIGDDGNLYGLFIENNTVTNTNEPYDPAKQDNYLRLYQILPYAGAPKASVKLTNTDWWTAMNGVDTQVSKGYAYMVEKEQNVAGIYSDRTIIKVFKFTDGTITKLLGDDEWNQRYDVYTWRLVGDVISFSGFDNVKSEMVMGTIDTTKVKNGEQDYLSVKAVASAAGASSQVLDMEILKPQQPKVDTGMNPLVTGLYVDPENLYSASIKFSKYMDKDLVDAGVHLKTGGTDVKNMKVWFSQTLHLIVDQNGTSLADTKPLDWNTPYELSVDAAVKDAWGWQLSSELPLSKLFTTRPETGWYPGFEDVTGVPAEKSDGYVGKYVTSTSTTAAATSKMTAIRLVQESGDPNFRVQFAARNKSSWGELTFSLKDHASQGTQAWTNIINLSLGNNGYNYSATDSNGMGVWGNDWNVRGFSNYWSRYTLDIYGDTLRLMIDYPDGTSAELINKSGLSLSSWSTTTAWDLDFRINSSNAVFDNFTVSKLTSTGADAGVTIISEIFSGGTITSALTSEITYSQ